MSVLNMKEETLINLTSEIAETVEKLIPYSLEKNKDIYILLEGKGYRGTHIPDVFAATTGIGLDKYIKRRTYTLILQKMDQEKFKKLKKKETKHGIHSFKSKCEKEFPFLDENLDVSKMQPYMDKQLIHLLINEQLEKKHINSMMNSAFKEITKGRELVAISKYSNRILIQDRDSIIVDLDKTYFKKNNTVFNISARENLMIDSEKESPSILLNGNIYFMPNCHTNANIAIRNLSKFYSDGYGFASSISVCTEWRGADWGIANLISSISCIENNISNIQLSEHNFITFEDGKVWLNTDYYIV